MPRNGPQPRGAEAVSRFPFSSSIRRSDRSGSGVGAVSAVAGLLDAPRHAEVQDEPIPEKPLLFGKAPTAVTHPGAPIRCLREIEEVDYEVELAYRYRPGSLLC